MKWIPCQFFTLFLLWTPGFSTALAFNSDNDPLLTRVQEARPRSQTNTDHLPLSSALSACANASDSLMGLMGLTLQRQGGPLAPSEVKMRGLGGARLSVTLSGLDLSDPGSGLVDANDLPFYAANAISTDSFAAQANSFGQLTLTLPSAKKFFATSRFGFGSFRTGRAEAIMGTPLWHFGEMVAAAQVSHTEGDFPFEQPAPMVRFNNDHLRASGLLKMNFKFKRTRAAMLLLGKFHEGGIAGFSTAPTSNLRARHSYFGGLREFTIQAKPITLVLRYKSRIDNRQTWQNASPDLSSASYFKNQLELEGTTYFDALHTQATLETHLETLHLLRSDFIRYGAGLGMNFKSQLGEGSPFGLQGGVTYTAYSSRDVLPVGFAQLNYQPSDALCLGAKLARSARMPTFSELYAPQGLIGGNAKLLPESAYDVELFLEWQWLQLAKLKLIGFGGQLDNTILYVNRSGIEIAPVNTGAARRLGLDARLEITPHSRLGLEWNAQVLNSSLDATGARLPGVPVFSTLLALRAGNVEQFCGWLRLNYKGPTSGNLFGTLEAPAYTLFDVVLRVPLGPSLNAHFSVTNLFNVLTAQDSNLLPLSGREFFALLELAT